MIGTSLLARGLAHILQQRYAGGLQYVHEGHDHSSSSSSTDAALAPATAKGLCLLAPVMQAASSADSMRAKLHIITGAYRRVN